MTNGDTNTLEDLARGYGEVANYLCERWDECDYCELGMWLKRNDKCKLGKLNDMAKELGIELGHV